MKRSTFLFLVLLVLVGCGSSEDDMATAVAQTVEALPTEADVPRPTATVKRIKLPTPEATNTPEPTSTDTATPTKTMTPSSTPTNTPTSTSTSTATPDAPFVEALGLAIIRKGDGQDWQQISTGLEGDIMWVLSVSEDGNWYEVLSNDNKTGWVEAEDVSGDLEIDALPVSTSVPTYTPTPTSTPSPTMTPTPDPRLAYGDIDLRELDTYPMNHIGEKVKLRGSVFNIFDMGNSFISIQGIQLETGNIVVVVHDLSDVDIPEGIYEGSWITVYGTVDGVFKGTNAFGGTITQPRIDADIIDK